MHYIVYLDEFGHIGPFQSRFDNEFNESPVFGLAGFILPFDEVRNLGTWFFKRKGELFKNSIRDSKKHPALWEIKGSGLYTPRYIKRFPEIKRMTNRLFNKINKLEGKIFYVGLEKKYSIERHDSKALYIKIVKESIKRIDQFCEERDKSKFLLVLDEHSLRQKIITEASIQMYNKTDPRRNLIEPPFQLESHRFQTIQAADWISGLVGKLGAYWKRADEYEDYSFLDDLFNDALLKVQIRSSIRSASR